MRPRKYILCGLLLAIALIVSGQQQIPDLVYKKAQFAFSEGIWMPDADPSRIGAQNFKTCTNLRPVKDGLRAVRGYSDINTTALAYPYIRTGIQMRKDDNSYILVHAHDASGNGKIYLNTTEPTSTGNFDTTAIYDDPSTDLTTYFTELPGGAVGWTNTEESYVYSAESLQLGGAFLVDDANLTDPVDRLKAANSDLDTTEHVIEVDTAVQRFLVVFTTRKLNGFNVTLKTVNSSVTTGNVAVSVFTGSSFVAVTTLVDNTASGGIPLKQSGTITFDSTVSSAEPYHFEGLSMFAYLIEWPTTTDATISNFSGRAPPQSLNNVWDGALRNTIQAQVVTSASNENVEYTLEVNEPSTTDFAVGMELDGLTSSQHVFLQYEERISALKVTMLGGYINKVSSTLTVQYLDADGTWTDVTNLVDGTADGGKTFARSGLITWTPADAVDEIPKTEYGGTGYSYKLTVGTTLTGTAGDSTPEVVVDLLFAIPAQETVPSYNFMGVFKGRVLGGGVSSENQGNRMDYSLTNAPDVWNGEETSRDGMQALYFGSDNEPLVAGAPLYNRYASTVKEFFVTFKKTKTYQLRGNGPENWEIDTVSNVVGCPAPKTLVGVDGFEIAERVYRRVLLWIDYSAPKLYDGASIIDLPGISNYFDPGDADCINYDAIHKSDGWYDPTYREWNIIIPTGTSTTPDTWLVYSIERRRWFEKNTGAADALRCGFLVRDDNGIRYPVGGTDSGELKYLESGGTWDGTAITQTVETGDWFPTESVWDRTIVKRLKFIARRLDESGATVKIVYYRDTSPTSMVAHKFVDRTDGSHSFVDRADGSHTFSSGSLLELDISTGTDRVIRASTVANRQAWSHGFGYTITTSSTEANLYIGWGATYAYLRMDK